MPELLLIGGPAPGLVSSVCLWVKERHDCEAFYLLMLESAALMPPIYHRVRHGCYFSVSDTYLVSI